FQNHGHDQRTTRGAFHDEALQVLADFFFDDAVVALFLVAGRFQGLQDSLAGLFHEPIFGGGAEAPGDNLGRGFDAAGELVDGEDGQDDAIFAEVAAIADDEVFDDFAQRAGIDADAADVDASAFARAQLVKLQHIAAFQHDDLADRAMHGSGQLAVALELAIFAVDRNEVARLDQIDDELELFLAGMAADVNGRAGAIFIDDVGAAPVKMIDHAIDAFFVAGNDARGEHDGIAIFDAGVLVIVDGGAGERRHGFA